MDVSGRARRVLWMRSKNFEDWPRGFRKRPNESWTRFVVDPSDRLMVDHCANFTRGSSTGHAARNQPRMTAAMDLALCRRRSPSFDKLCRELKQRLRGSAFDS